ncbi:MAG: hypothetical protein HQL27_03855 [Candidatus Omnitrophica bacterium]|nr:hypothetical protein [Candidatus Omnitrophota bacterium]
MSWTRLDDGAKILKTKLLKEILRRFTPQSKYGINNITFLESVNNKYKGGVKSAPA